MHKCLTRSLALLLTPCLIMAPSSHSPTHVADFNTQVLMLHPAFVRPAPETVAPPTMRSFFKECQIAPLFLLAFSPTDWLVNMYEDYFWLVPIIAIAITAFSFLVISVNSYQRVVIRRAKSQVHKAVNNLYERLRRRSYPETIPNACYYWLRTVMRSGYPIFVLRYLESLLARTPDGLSEPATKAWIELAKGMTVWIRDMELKKRGSEPSRILFRANRPNKDPESLKTYLEILLNDRAQKESVSKLNTSSPAETADEYFALGLESLLIPQCAPPKGIWQTIIARLQARMLMKRHGAPPLTFADLNNLVNVPISDTTAIHPKEYEIFQDVAAYVLNQTFVPSLEKTGAQLLFAGPHLLPADFNQRLALAPLVSTEHGDELWLSLHGRVEHDLYLTEEGIAVGVLVMTRDGNVWVADSLKWVTDQNVLVLKKLGPARLHRIFEKASNGVNLIHELELPMSKNAFQLMYAMLNSEIAAFGRLWQLTKIEMDGNGFFLTFQTVQHVRTEMARAA